MGTIEEPAAKLAEAAIEFTELFLQVQADLRNPDVSTADMVDRMEAKNNALRLYTHLRGTV
jgi:hypothetical protein